MRPCLRFRPHALLALVLCLIASPPGRANNDLGRDVVLQWNQLLQDVLPPAANPLTPRSFAMVHIAQFDAINAIERRYQPYRSRPWASHGASTQAAAAQAAHDVLVALVPACQSACDAALAAQLADLPPGLARQGVEVGRAAARAILEWRANDGATATPPAFLLPPLPGLWQPAVAGTPAVFTQLRDMRPFGLWSATQFLPRRFPELDSAQYADDFAEVKRLGSATSAERTPEQTRLARLVAGVTSRTSIVAAWNNVARDLAVARGLSMLDTARVFALLNAVMQDGLLTSQGSKFVYGLWRPQTAIRRADEDGNPATEAEADWSALLGNPGYPAYAGNVACIGASSARALALAFGGDAQTFTVLWRGNAGNPDVPLPYSSLWQFAVDGADSRIFGGIHFRFDGAASQDACPRVADFIHARYMRPLWR